MTARFMAMMLAGAPPLGEESGLIRRIDLQNSADGWRLDDSVLTLGGPSGESRLALSIKSDQQLTERGFPDEFVTAVWEHWLGKGTTVFDRSRDYLGIVVGSISLKVRKAWHDLLAQALDADAQRLLSRLETRVMNKIQKNMFRSLRCNLPGEVISDEETTSLLRQSRLLDLDFGDVDSRANQEAVGICRDALESRSRDEAGELWDKLLRIARELGPTGGTLDLGGLMERLRGRFRLKEYPDYASDLRCVSEASDRLLEELTDRIGGTVALDRCAELGRISSVLESHQGVALLGASGSGKTVLAKHLAEAAKAGGVVAWFDGQLLDEPNLASVESGLSLRHNLATLFPHVTAARALLVLDGLDRFSEDARRNAARLIKLTRLEDSGGPWKVLITCQPEDWEAAAARLRTLGVPLEAIKTETVDFPASEQLKPVWEAFPNLRALSYRRELSLVLRNVQLLNVVASNAPHAGSISTGKWVGESHLIRWFWSDVVGIGPSGHARSQLLQKLGRNEADGPSARTALSGLSSAEAVVLRELESMRICRVRDDRISFAHDLFGDWARLRILLSESECLDEFLEERITTPRWFKAVRLFGLDLLEQQGGDVTAWRDALERLRSVAGRYDLRTDLLLESVIFAANPAPLLEAICPVLIGDEGILLRRLLNRFLYVATVPNSLMSLLMEKGEEPSSIAATMDRDPDWPLWRSMLEFLAAHADDVAALAPKEGSLVANTWLRKTDRKWPWRKEAARLAVVIAKQCGSSSERRSRHREDEESKSVLCSLVAACSEQNEDVTTILLSLCKRRPENGTSKATDDRSSRRRLSVKLPWRSTEAPLPPAWPDGPSERVDEPVQSVFLDSGTLAPLFPQHASLAREVILALTIKHPVPVEVGDHYRGFHRDYETESPRDWNAHIWLRGPFFAFLMQRPEEGLDTILRLVNHATERWADDMERHGRRRSQ